MNQGTSRFVDLIAVIKRKVTRISESRRLKHLLTSMSGEAKAILFYLIILFGCVPFMLPFLAMGFSQGESNVLKKGILFVGYPFSFLGLVGLGCIRMFNNSDSNRLITFLLVSAALWLPFLVIVIL